jgi:hypothetical protein
MYTETKKQKKKKLATLMMDYLLAPEPMQVGKSKYHIERGIE